MAKQTKKIIAERKAQLIAAGLPTEEMARPEINEKIEMVTGGWDGVAECIIEAWKNSLIPLTEAEHIPNETAAPVTGSTDIASRIEKEVETGIATFDANKLTIAAWKEKYGELKFSGDLKDTENINMIMEGWRLARTTRLSIEKREDFLKAPLIAGSKKIGGVAAEYYTLLGEIETPMKKQRDLIEAAKEEEKNKAALAAEAEGKRRVDELKAAGMSFDGSFYVIGETISADYSTLKAMPVDEFEKFFGKVEAEKNRIDQEEANKLAELKKARLLMRGNMLAGIGMAVDADGTYTSEHTEGVKVMQACLTDEPDDKFMSLLSSLTGRITDAKKKAEEELTKKAQDRTVALRSKLILAAGMERVDFIPGSTQAGFYFKNEFTECKFTLPSVGELSDDDFDKKLEDFEKLITEAKAAAVTKEENDKAAALLAKDRREQLVALGMTSAPNQSCYIFNLPDVVTRCSVAYGELTGQSVEQWEATVKDVTSVITDIKNQQKAFEEKAADDKKKKEEKETADALIFTQRQYDLVNIGMVIVDKMFFMIRNEFGDVASISIEEVKAIDADTWPRRLTEVTKSVMDVVKATTEKRQAAIDKLEAAKPEAEKFKAYMMAILEIAHPILEDAELLGIWERLETKLTDALGTASAEVDRKINAAQPVGA